MSGVNLRLSGFVEQTSRHGSITTTTNSNGEFVFTTLGMFDMDQGVRIDISDPGHHSPSIHGVFYADQNVKNLYFHFLPSFFNVDNWTLGGSAQSDQNGYSNPYTLCSSNDDKCLNFNDEAFSAMQEQGGYCFDVQLYGNRTSFGELIWPVANFETASVGAESGASEGCPNGIDLSPFFDNESVALGETYWIEICQTCCDGDQYPVLLEDPLENCKHFAIEFKAVDPTAVEFSLSNGGGTNFQLGRSENRPGIEVGPQVAIINPVILGGSQAQNLTVRIEEISCEGDEDPVLLGEQTFTDLNNLISVSLGSLIDTPNPFILAAYNLNDPSAWEDLLLRCFKVTLLTETECGISEAFSYFSFDPNCRFCLVEQGESDFLYEPFESPSFLFSSEVTVTPNPVIKGSVISVNLSMVTSTIRTACLFTQAGRKVVDFTAKDGKSSNIDFRIPDNLASGLYFLRIEGEANSEVFKLIVQ